MDKDREIIDNLLLSGAMQVCGIDETTGEFLYQFTPKLKDVMPELYREHLNNVNAEIMKLWEDGFVSMDLFADSPIVTLTEKAFDKEAISKLSQEDQWSLSEIKRVLFSKEF